MATVSSSRTDIHWSLIVSRLLFSIGAVVSMLALVNLTNIVDQQVAERRCNFELATETDRIDSEINVKEAQIFEAAILRPNPGEGSTAELQRLANELHILIEDRRVAYVERDNARERCE